MTIYEMYKYYEFNSRVQFTKVKLIRYIIINYQRKLLSLKDF